MVMSFGLTNALIFFYDILFYSCTLEDHVGHVELMLIELQNHQ